MNEELTAKAEVTIHAPAETVWEALVNPAVIKRYMFGTTVVSDWKEGDPIVWKGEWKGKPYEDKGRILELREGRRLRYSHFSPLSGAPDRPESYHQVTIDLARLEPDGGVRVELSQDNNQTAKARDESQKNWQTMLEGLRKVVEGRPAGA